MNKLLPVEVIRDEDGFFYHPTYSLLLDELLQEKEYPTQEEWDTFKKELNIETHCVWLEDDADRNVVDRYFDGYPEACKEWNPSKPLEEGDWFIVSIHDTEDGAVCLWVKNL